MGQKTRLSAFLLAFACVLFLQRQPSFAQQQAQHQPAQQHLPRIDDPSAFAAVGTLPTDCDLVLVIENAAEFRKTGLSSAIRTLFDPGGPLEASRSAWQALAQQLGLADEEAFDRLLGGRVILLARGIDTPDAAQWVLLSQVTQDTDRLFKQRLQAAPRKIAKGQQLLAIEQGQYELTSYLRSPNLKHPAADERSVTAMLAPAGRGQLLDLMLGILTGAPEAPVARLRDEPVLARARALGQPQILLLSRLGPRNPPAQNAEPGAQAVGAGAAEGGVGGWADFLVLAARRDDPAAAPSRWSARIVIRERARQKQLLDAGVSDDALFNALRAGRGENETSLLTVVQMAPLATIFGRAIPFDDPLTRLPWPPAAAELFTGRQAVRIHTAPGAPPDSAPGLVCTLAMETFDRIRLARVLDPAVCTFFEAVEREAGQRDASTPSLPAFSGFAPHAPRILSIELGATGQLAGVTGAGLTAAWAFPSSTPEPRGWWSLAMSAAGDGSPRAVSAVRDVAAAAGAPLGELRRWIWLMSARPHDLEALIAPGVPDYRGIRSFMKQVSEAGCRLSITEDGDVKGEFTLQLFEPAQVP